MANSFAVSKAQLIYALCLPLAVLVGYLLADPTDLSSFLFFLGMVGVLAIPVLLRWHHWLLIAGWNAVFAPAFLPGQPPMWMLMAAASLLFAVLNRSISAEKAFTNVPGLTRSLLFLALVIIGTAIASGGLGLRSFGSSSYGGKGYFYLLFAIAGYFAFTSQRVPIGKANTMVSVFFLSSLTAFLGLLYMAGPGFYFIFDFVPASQVAEQATAEMADAPFVRYTSLVLPSAGVYGFLFARYGLRGILDLNRPWRLGLFILAGVGCFLTGFRSYVIILAVTFTIMVFLEGLHRTRLFPLVAGAVVLAGGLLFVSAERLPLVAQRSLSFLPVKVDPMIRQSAEASSEWRLEMWKNVLQDIPKYLIKGKGYALDPTDLAMAQESVMRGFAPLYNTSALAGNYHNGPLSVIIPFGIFGVIAFGWFAAAALRSLWRNYRYGAAELKRINTYLLAAFLTKFVFFLLIFGSFAHEFWILTGLVGLSVSLNGGVSKAPEEQQDVVEDELEELELA